MLSLPNGNVSIFFGCYDSFVYCLNVDRNGLFINLQWKFETYRKIFSTPKLYHSSNQSTNISLVACCTNGTVCIVNALNGRFQRQFRISGDVFSSPVICDNSMIVGCRDNFVYSFNLNE